jgi:KDO2-lipid IV(A) lauroyltransferase
VEYDEQLKEDIMNRQSVVLLTSHQFNWEWALHATKLHMDFPFEVVYQRLQNKSFDKYMNESRTHFGVILIEKSAIVKHTVGTRKEFKALTLLADQRPARKAQKYWITFMNQDTPFVMGPEVLSQALNAPVYLHAVERIRRGHYKVRILNLTRPPYEKGNSGILEAYVEGLEKVIRNDPAGYLWSHKRWKFRRENG